MLAGVSRTKVYAKHKTVVSVEADEVLTLMQLRFTSLTLTNSWRDLPTPVCANAGRKTRLAFQISRFRLKLDQELCLVLALEPPRGQTSTGPFFA